MTSAVEMSFNPSARALQFTGSNAEAIKGFLGAAEYKSNKNDTEWTFTADKDHPTDSRVEWPIKVRPGQHVVKFMNNIGVYDDKELANLIAG